MSPDSIEIPTLLTERLRLRPFRRSDVDDYAAMNAVYAEYFGNAPPARYCIRADFVKPGALVEISSIAQLA